MKYQPPFGSGDPDAPYVDRNTPGAVVGSKVPAAAIEDPQRELVALIQAAGLTPDENVLNQVPHAIQSSKLNYAVATGTATALLVALSPALLTYSAGLVLRVKVANDATGATTVNVDGLGVKAVGDSSGSAVISGLWRAGDVLELVYDGTMFRVLAGNTIVSGPFSSTYSTPVSMSNLVLTQAGLASGSAPFGSIASNAFTFTRAGIYAVSVSMALALNYSGQVGIGGVCLIRKNGASIIGGSGQDTNYATSPASFNPTATALIAAVPGDAVTAHGQVSVASGFTSASITSTSIAITPIS
ncbi:hypothetical protein ACC699_17180 [Rhizobium ruizarguesonis]